MVYNFIVVCSYALAVASIGAGLMHWAFDVWQAPSTGTSDPGRSDGISIVAWTGSAFLMGQGVLSQIWLLLALFGWFTPEIVGAVLVLAALCGLRWAIVPAKALATTLIREMQRLRHEAWAWCGVAGCCLVVVFLSGAEGLLLPIHGGGDAAANYMALPKLTAASHQLIPLPGTEYVAQLGLVGEMHSAALMSLGMGSAAKSFCWAAGLAGTCMLLALGGAAGVGRRGQWVMVAMVWTSATFLVHVWDGKVDLFGTAAGVAAYFWVIRATQSHAAGAIGHGDWPSMGCLRMVGFFTVLAIVSKLTLLAAMVPGLLLLVAWRVLLRLPRSGESASAGGATPIWLTLRSLFVLAISGFTILAPQLLKNAVLFGEPLAPVLFMFSPHKSEMDGTVLTMADARYIFSIYPLALVFGRFSNMGWPLSPLILVLLPLTAFLPRSPSLARSTLFQLTVAAVVECVVWHLFRPANFAPRYMLPTLLLFTLAPAAAAEYISRREFRPRLLAGVVLFCLFFGTLLQARLFFVFDNLLIVFKNELRHRPNYPSNYAGPSRASEVVNQDAAAGERVLLGMFDQYWLRADLIRTHGERGHLPASTPEEESPPGRWRLAFTQGYRYVLLDINTGPGKALAVELGIMSDGSVPAAPDDLRVEKLFHEDKCMVLRVRAVH